MHSGLKRRARACLLASGVLPPTAAAIVIGISLGAPGRSGYLPARPTAGELVAAAGQHVPLEVKPDPVWLGRFAQGQAAECKFLVLNPGCEAVWIERAQTSCTCLDVGSVPVCVGPGEGRALNVGYDPADDPEFAGRLSVEVTGLDGTGDVPDAR